VGQKVHPGGMRLGIIHDWKAHWYTERQFASFLRETWPSGAHIQAKMGHAGLSGIVIRKDTNKLSIDINTARPGIVIGKSGAEVDALRRELFDMTGKAVHGQHRRDQAARARRDSGRAIHRRAAG